LLKYITTTEKNHISVHRVNFLFLNQTFHYTRRIAPKRVTSWWCPSPCHNAKATQLPA